MPHYLYPGAWIISSSVFRRLIRGYFLTPCETFCRRNWPPKWTVLRQRGYVTSA
ncbi:hypothetical protein AHF37_10981 [Paragonimus kellicotti]|nr:hypothetical protein AHF37_10981 [Paragonimus kellicotti]